MATAKSLTASELQTVLAYTATQPYAQRNRAMLLMTVAAGLRVSEVAGLTVGDVLDSKGCVRGDVFLAAHRVKHQHTRIIYINSRLQQELTDFIASLHASTKTQRCRCSQHSADHAAVCHPTHWHNTFIGCIARLALVVPVRTVVARHSSHRSLHRVFQCSFLHHLLDTRASQPLNATSPSMMK